MAWDPSKPWPGSAGGASSPRWGGYIRLFVRAAIASGTTFHLGTHPNDRLSAGNVLGGATAAQRAGVSRLWVDLSCDVLDVDLQHGATAGAGIFTKADAATCALTLADPDGIYDPAASVPPFSYNGVSRLVPGVPVEVFAEVVDAVSSAVTTHYLFTGTVETWREDWTPQRSSRKAVVVASDATRTWVRYDRPEQPAVGSGEGVAQRIQRLVTFYGWPGTIETTATAGSGVGLLPTTLAATGWELLGRTLDDELGVVFFTTRGALRWTKRGDWFLTPPPVLALGCKALEPVDFVDTFDEPDGTTLGPEWSEARGDWGIVGGDAALLAHNTNALREIAYRPTASADGIVTFAWGAGGAQNGQGVCFRVKDDLNCCLTSWNTLTATIQIQIFVNGSGSTIVTFPASGAAGASFAVELAGPLITIRNGSTGAVIGSGSTAHCQTETGVGLTAINAMALAARWAYVGFDYTSLPYHDVLTDATPSNADAQVRNTVRAARVGGTTQTATDAASVNANGPYEYLRSDLGLSTDAYVTTWAADVVKASAWPRIVLEDLEMAPGIDPASWDLWPTVLDIRYVSDRVRVVWAPPERPEARSDQTTRVVGASHKITRGGWRVKWQLVGTFTADPASAATTPATAAELVDA